MSLYCPPPGFLSRKRLCGNIATSWDPDHEIARPSYDRQYPEFKHKIPAAATIRIMRDAKQTLDQSFLEMRWRCLSLAADLDRIERSPGGGNVAETDPRLRALRDAIKILLDAPGNRAEQVQLLLSDRNPAPR